MGKLFSGRYSTRDGQTHQSENLTEEEVRKVADTRDPDVTSARYAEVLDTDHDDR